MTTGRYIIIDIFILPTVSIGSIISFGILFLIFYHRRQFPIDTSKLLICNTYLAIILACLTLLDLYAHNVYGIIHPNVSFDNWWCYGCIYLLYVGLCSLYFSCLLQAVFRLFRVVFYKHKQLQNFRFIFLLVLIQWLLAFVLMMLPLFLDYFEYMPQLYQCNILFSNFNGIMIVSSIVFFGPISAIGAIYCYIMYYIKHTTNSAIHQNHQQANQRDFIVLRRISILVGILTILSIPTIILWLYYLITGYLNPLTPHIEWLINSISFLILSIAFLFLSPQLREVLSFAWRHNRRVQPVMIIQSH